MNEAFLALGGNLGDRSANINAAKNELKSHSIIINRQSSIYETEPWGMNSSLKFLNQCIYIKTFYSASELLSTCLEVEKKLGRQRKTSEYMERSIDIDILFFNHEIIFDKNIEIPHPRLHLRKFVLIPLVEIEPELQHPVFKKCIRELLEDCNDNCGVARFL